MKRGGNMWDGMGMSETGWKYVGQSENEWDGVRMSGTERKCVERSENM